MQTENTLPQKSFERNMNHNYMVLSRLDFFGCKEDTQDYRVRMLLDNRISGLLGVSHRIVNGESRYYYEINSLQSMDRVYAKDELDYEQLCALLLGCIRLYNGLEEYLLDGSQVILKPEYIYLNMDTHEPYFVYFPDYESDARDSFAAFIEELLRKVDHTDEQAVMLAYQVYRCTRNQNYVLAEILAMIEQPQEKAGASAQDEAEPFTAQSRYEDWDNPEPAESSYEREAPQEAAPSEDSGDSGNGGELKHAIMCFALSVCALGLLGGNSLLGLYPLSGQQVLYLYGAISMSVMAGVIFLACYFKKKNRKKELQRLETPQEEAPMQIYHQEQADEVIPLQEHYEEPQEAYGYGDTICLQQLSSQEPYLSGTVNGREVNIRLGRLPVTIGKMAGKADCIIADNTVSKLHAKIMEKNGAIYVEDLNSTNGTLRNGVMIGMNEPVLLQTGDELTLGRVKLTLCG